MLSDWLLLAECQSVVFITWMCLLSDCLEGYLGVSLNFLLIIISPEIDTEWDECVLSSNRDAMESDLKESSSP